MQEGDTVVFLDRKRDLQVAALVPILVGPQGAGVGNVDGTVDDAWLSCRNGIVCE